MAVPIRSDRTRSLGLGLLLSCAAGAAAAQPAGVVYGGGSVGADESAYLGTMLPLAGGSLGHGPAVRASVSGSRYDYLSLGRKIEGKQVRGEIGGALQTSGDWGYANLGLAGRYTDTKLSPRDPGNKRGGGQWDVVVSLDGAHVAGPWRAVLFTSYGFDAKDYYARGDVTYAVTPMARIGAEVGVDGDRAYDRRRLGAVVAFTSNANWEVRLSAGSMESDAKDGAYGGIGFTRVF